ncbi:MAG: hypothetical protein FWF52_01185 [Candidatus Azobacteroides sp.]|nr:hypothetical protein [Candidatus Azobacteroides sp.]
MKLVFGILIVGFFLSKFDRWANKRLPIKKIRPVKKEIIYINGIPFENTLYDIVE